MGIHGKGEGEGGETDRDMRGHHRKVAHAWEP